MITVLNVRSNPWTFARKYVLGDDKNCVLKECGIEWSIGEHSFERKT